MSDLFTDHLAGKAERHPQDTALWDSGLTVTYRELDAAANRVAARLALGGVAGGDRVLLIADNSAAYLAAAFGIWRAGAVLVTIYPSSGADEISYAISNSSPSYIITDTRAGERLPNGPAAALPHLVIDNGTVYSGETATGPTGIPPLSDPDGLALICYTSGSTSHPKAVMHSHRGLMAGARGYAQVWHLGPTDRTVVSLPMAWAFGLVTTSMATLVAGGVVDILARTRPESLIAAVSDRGATFLAGVTTMFVKLNEHLATRGGPADMSSLRLCISGGEPRNETAFSKWTLATGCPVHDVYAASEAFPVITYDPTIDPRPVPGSAGKVVPGAQMRIVDDNGADVPPGTPGEALWKAPALFLGYWADDITTAAALTTDGWYRTKDLVRVDENGYVFVVGRLSDMIIRGGSNVSPSEVEAVIREHPSIAAVAVIGVHDDTYGQAVVAAVQPTDPDSFEPGTITAYCRDRLAGYKVPTEIVIVKEFPLNPRTAKIDRSRLARELSTLERTP